VYGGRGPNVYDCYGLSMEINRRRGIKLRDFSPIDEPSVVGNILDEGIIECCIKLEKAEPFCFVLFCIHPKYATHIGIVLEDCQRFIHTLPKREVVIERLDSIIWKSRIKGYYRYVLTDN